VIDKKQLLEDAEWLLHGQPADAWDGERYARIASVLRRVAEGTPAFAAISSEMDGFNIALDHPGIYCVGPSQYGLNHRVFSEDTRPVIIVEVK
jgi:hypothetical protein